MNNLGEFSDNNDQIYTLFRVSSTKLSDFIKTSYKNKLNIKDFSQFIFESHGYGEDKQKTSPTPESKKIMMEQGFVCINTSKEVSPFSSDIVLLDGFNRLINGEVPEQDIFVKVYHNMSIDQELVFYYEANSHKNYKYNSARDKTISSQFIDRGFLLYLTLRTGIQWNNRTRNLILNYFDSSNYSYRHAANKRAHLLDRMIYDNPYFMKDIDFIIYLSNLNNADIIETELIRLLGAFRAHELFGNSLGDYAKVGNDNKKDLSIAKVNGEFSRELLDKFFKDDLVVKNLEKFETSKKREDIQIAMWEHFISSFFLPHYAGVEVELSLNAKKDKVKQEKDELFKTWEIIKFPRLSKIEAEKEYFKIGETYKLYCENQDATEYRLIDVVYTGIKKAIRPAGVVLTIEVDCHIFYSEELKLIKLRDPKGFGKGMFSKWNKYDLPHGEYNVQIGTFWNNVSKLDKMYLITEKKTKASKK